jgi:zinc transporter
LPDSAKQACASEAAPGRRPEFPLDDLGQEGDEPRSPTAVPGSETRDRRTQLHEIADRVIRYVEDLDLVRERSAVLQDELLNQVSLRMSKTMYLLSVVAALILPPSFIAQLFGMSVGGIPGAIGSAGFWVIVVLLGMLIAAELWFFRRLKWI